MVSTNKTLYVSLYLSEAAKIEQPNSYQAFQIDFDHDTKKLQP
jgi:hypothetical protein